MAKKVTEQLMKQLKIEGTNAKGEKTMNTELKVKDLVGTNVEKEVIANA